MARGCRAGFTKVGRNIMQAGRTEGSNGLLVAEPQAPASEVKRVRGVVGWVARWRGGEVRAPAGSLPSVKGRVANRGEAGALTGKDGGCGERRGKLEIQVATRGLQWFK